MSTKSNVIRMPLPPVDIRDVPMKIREVEGFDVHWAEVEARGEFDTARFIEDLRELERLEDAAGEPTGVDWQVFATWLILGSVCLVFWFQLLTWMRFL